MKYIIHNSNNVVTKVKTVSREGRIQALRDYIDEARSQVKSDVGPSIYKVYDSENNLVKSDVGPSIYKVYDSENNLIEHRQSTGWRDVK